MKDLGVKLAEARHQFDRLNIGKRTAQRLKTTGLRILTYVVLLELGFIFILPLLYMVSTSTKSIGDLLDESVVWLPSGIYWDNFAKAYEQMNFSVTVKNSIMMAFVPMIGQVLSCAVAGYGLGRYQFRGSKLIFGLVLFCLIIPPQTIIISLYSFFSQLGWINTYAPFIVPAFFAQGLRGALFMLIFTQFFRGLPKELDEAARIDGAGALRVFVTVMLPLAKPALFVVAMFSLVWQWNDNYMAQFFVNLPDLRPLPNQLDQMNATYMIAGGKPDGLNKGVLMAACLMVVMPLFLVYLIGQRYLVEGIERTGLTGD